MANCLKYWVVYACCTSLLLFVDFYFDLQAAKLSKILYVRCSLPYCSSTKWCMFLQKYICRIIENTVFYKSCFLQSCVIESFSSKQERHLEKSILLACPSHFSFSILHLPVTRTINKFYQYLAGCLLFCIFSPKAMLFWQLLSGAFHFSPVALIPAKNNKTNKANVTVLNLRDSDLDPKNRRGQLNEYCSVDSWENSNGILFLV